MNITRILLGFIGVCLTMTGYAAETQEQDFRGRVRAATWSYESTVTLEAAREKAREFREGGINTMLTNGHRYLFPISNDPKEYNDPFHFELWPTEESNAATSNVVAAMRENGIRVIHHTTAAYCPKLEMEKHPDWCQESIMEPGKPIFFGEYGGVYMWCLNNPEFRNEYYKIVLELQQKFNFDGWMIDEVEWLPDWFVCGCKHCREKFTKETGYELPTDKDSPIWGNFDDPIWRAWIAARMRWCGDFFKDMRSYLVANGLPADFPLTACHAGMVDTWSAQYWGIDVIDLTSGINWIFYEAYVQQGATFYSWRRFLAEVQAYGALARVKTDQPAFILFYPRGDDNELSWSWAASYAMGQRLWTDRVPQPNFPWERRHEYLTYPNGSEVVDVALLFSKANRDFLRKDGNLKLKTLDAYGRDYNRGYIDEWGAWAECLIANNIPHRIILEEDLTTQNLAQYKAVCLPSTECLSDDMVAALLEYAANGGRLIISGEPAIKDETGARFQDNALSAKLLQAAHTAIDSDQAEAAFRGYSRMKSPSTEPNIESVQELKSKIASAVSDSERSWIVAAPEGVVVKVWQNEQKSRLRIDALNCVGGDLPVDTVLEKGYPVDFQPANVTVRLAKGLAGKAKSAVLYDPATSTSKVIAIQNDGTICKVNFDINGPLAVVEFELNPLEQNIDWLKTQNANWQVLPETLTPAQADELAEGMKTKGINSVLTDKHRYILYDTDAYDPTTSGAFQNIWQGRPLRQSAEVTRNLVDACHKRDIRVIWHTTYCMVSTDLIERYPSWAQQDLRKPGEPAYFEFYGGNWNMCLNNPDARQAYFQRVADLTRETGVDGWMIDEVEWLPDWFACGCEVCRKQFKDATGMDIPTGEAVKDISNLDNPIWRAWISWRMTCTGKFFADLRSYMDTQNLGHLAYTCCHAGVGDTWSGQVWGIDEFELAKGMNFCFYEAYIRNGAPYFGWKRHLTELDLYGAIARNRTPEYPVLSLFYPRNQTESRFLSFMTYMAGHRPWVTYTDLKTEFAATQWNSEHTQLFSSDQTDIANVGLYFSKPTRDLIGSNTELENNRHYINKFAAWDITFSERNIPRTIVIDEDLTSERMKNLQYLIVPAALCMSKTSVQAIVKWTKTGGKLILVGDDVASRDETGATNESNVADELKAVAYKVLADTDGNPNHKAFYGIMGKPWQDGRSPEFMAQAVAYIDELKPIVPYNTNAPHGDVAIRAWRMPSGDIALHLLNTSGAQLSEGDTVPATEPKPETAWNEVATFTVTLNTTALPELATLKSAQVTAFSGNSKASFNPQTGELKITGLKDYAVVILSKK